MLRQNIPRVLVRPDVDTVPGPAPCAAPVQARRPGTPVSMQIWRENRVTNGPYKSVGLHFTGARKAGFGSDWTCRV